ncbi:MAG: caspase family protein [Coleofasciculaceae cyanobacterium SM2_1_6]|nr:caspase family protein [Coleofasciculaceae cyanobacterium SM2_1_6]
MSHICRILWKDACILWASGHDRNTKIFCNGLFMARYALVVGIPEYSHLPSPLSKTQGDAEAVASLLRLHGDFQEVTLLNPKRLTKDELFKELDRLLIQQAVGSEVLIYYTGHGVLMEDCGVVRGFLAPSNCVYTKENVTNGIPFDSLNQLIGKSQLSSLVMLLDCCHSGSLLKSIAKIFTAFNSEKNYALMAACRDFEEAAAMKKEPHSIFTGALLQGLAKENANDRDQINTSFLFGFIEDRLRLTGQEPVKLSYGQSIKIVDYRAMQPEQPIVDICPYVGLNAFDFEKGTAGFFKGRDRFVRLLWQKLQESNFVPVIGASGSGNLPLSGQDWFLFSKLREIGTSCQPSSRGIP